MEAAIAAVQGDRQNLTAEAADVLYHLLVVLQGANIPLSDVMAELERRTAQSGLRRRPRASFEWRRGGSHGPAQQLIPPTRTMTGCRPIARFPRDEWAKLRADAPMTLDRRRGDAAAIPQRPDLARRGRGDLPAALAPAVPLRRGDAGAVQGDPALPAAENDGKVPYIIGVAGSVAVGKSTTARVLRRCWRAGPTRRRSTSSPPTGSSCPTPS